MDTGNSFDLKEQSVYEALGNDAGELKVEDDADELLELSEKKKKPQEKQEQAILQDEFKTARHLALTQSHLARRQRIAEQFTCSGTGIPTGSFRSACNSPVQTRSPPGAFTLTRP